MLSHRMKKAQSEVQQTLWTSFDFTYKDVADVTTEEISYLEGKKTWLEILLANYSTNSISKIQMAEHLSRGVIDDIDQTLTSIITKVSVRAHYAIDSITQICACVKTPVSHDEFCSSDCQTEMGQTKLYISITAP